MISNKSKLIKSDKARFSDKKYLFQFLNKTLGCYLSLGCDPSLKLSRQDGFNEGSQHMLKYDKYEKLFNSNPFSAFFSGTPRLLVQNETRFSFIVYVFL